jgi:hypothetical protein
VTTESGGRAQATARTLRVFLAQGFTQLLLLRCRAELLPGEGRTTQRSSAGGGGGVGSPDPVEREVPYMALTERLHNTAARRSI